MAEFHAAVEGDQATHEAGGAVEWLDDFAGGKVGEFETEFAPGRGDAYDGVCGDVDEAEDDAVVGDGAGRGGAVDRVAQLKTPAADVVDAAGGRR